MNQRQVRTSGRPMYGRPSYLRPAARPRPKRPQMSSMQKRLLWLVVGILIVLFGIWRTFAISQISVQGVPAGDKLMTESQKLVSASFDQGNLLTFDSEKFASALQQLDPRLKTVAVTRKWTHGIVIRVTLMQPTLGWDSDNRYYVLDPDGNAIGTLPVSSALPVVTDDSNLPVAIGQQVAPSTFVAYVSQLVPQLVASGVHIKSIDIKDTTFDLYVTTSTGYQLIFDTTRTVESEMSDYKTVMQTLAKQHATPSQYIDLRIQGRAYWQ